MFASFVRGNIYQDNKMKVNEHLLSKEALKKFNVAVPRYTSYPTAPEWNDKVTQENCLKAVKTAKDQDSIALYLHIPFCEKLCWYCGCNTIIKKQKSHSETYVKYLIKEIDLVASSLNGKRVNVSQLHWGGGSPNFLTDKQCVAVLDKLDECFDIDYSGEIAIEIDPRTTTEEQIRLYRKLGFNRISMGVQDFDADVQKAINRIQPYEKIAEMTALCRELGFNSVNFDLIYGLPKQSRESFQKTLELTEKLAPDRIALYSFAWLPNARNHMSLIKEEDLPSPQEKMDIFLDARKFFCEGEYIDIAMDHFARKNDELSIAYKNGELHRNFMGYTVQTLRDNIGFGMSAISYIDHTYLQNYKTLAEYYAAVEKGELPIQNAKKLSADDVMRQWVISKLMCTLKLERGAFKERFGEDFDRTFSEELGLLGEFILDGYVSDDDLALRVNDSGRLLMRNICSVFDAYYHKTKRTFSKAI